MSIRDLIMVFEVHIKEEVHSISYQTKLKPMCLVYTANYKHAYCMYKTYNYIIHMYVCFTTKKHVLTKISLSQSLAKLSPWNFCHGWEGGSQIEQIQEICRGQGSEWWQHLIANTVMANSLWKKKIKIYTSEMLQWCDSEILLYSSHLFLKTQKREHILF